jgi:pimeloyl-ACP methyl ester carboxylesterase
VFDKNLFKIDKIWKLVKNLPKIESSHIPETDTLVMWGGKDSGIPWDSQKKLIKKLKRKKIVAFDGGHYFYLHQPKSFIKTIIDFL